MVQLMLLHSTPQTSLLLLTQAVMEKRPLNECSSSSSSSCFLELMEAKQLTLGSAGKRPPRKVAAVLKVV